MFRVFIRSYHIASMLILFALAGSAVAEPTARMTVDPQSATIGDPVSIMITQPGVETGDAVWPDLTSGLVGELHILTVDTLKNRDAKKLGGATLELTVAAYDTGHFEIGPFTFDDEKFAFPIPQQMISIQSVLTDSTGTEFNPYKAQEDLPITLADLLRWTLPWLIGIAAILLIIYFIRKWMKNKKLQEEEWVAPPVPPYEEAVRALARLKIDSPLKRGDLKGYVTSLGQIVKRLLARVHDDSVLEMTTGEVRKWARNKELNCQPTALIALLEQGDAVKFAKRVLDTTECDRLYEEAEKIVICYKPLPEVVLEGEGKKEAKQPSENDGKKVDVKEEKKEKVEVDHE